MSRTKRYWILQIVGWTLYGILGLIIGNSFYKMDASTVFWNFLAAAVMLLSTHLLRYKIKLDGWLTLKIGKLIARLIPALLVLSLLANGINTGYGLLMTDIIDKEKFTFFIFLLYTFQTLIYFALWTAIYLIIFYFRNYKQEEIEKWRLQAAVKDAELIALKAQINPHFLFNALNNIRALILEDHMKARDMVSHLSELLRYSIQFNDNEKVTVEDELEIVVKYLELETIHYEDRLKFEIKIQDELKKSKIPPMIIQLMAENAIKHGISQEKGGGNILISIEKLKDDLIVEVSNTGKLKEAEGDGIGLKNATERIRILFDKEPDLELTQQGDMVRSTLKIPLEQ
jgi:two-component system, LytTR family, sensor kinase